MPRLVSMPKRKAGDKGLAEKYSKEIDEVCCEMHMPQWSRDVISNEVIMDPILLPCGHRFDRENLCYKHLSAKPFLEKCPVHSCEEYVDVETIKKSSNLALKRDIQREEQRRQVCYEAKYKELLFKMQEDIKQDLDAAVHKRLKHAH